MREIALKIEFNYLLDVGPVYDNIRLVRRGSSDEFQAHRRLPSTASVFEYVVIFNGRRRQSKADNKHIHVCGLLFITALS